MKYKDYYKLFTENEFKLESPKSDQWYKTFDAFFPDANQREEPLHVFFEYEDWTDYLDFEDSIEIEFLKEFLKHFKLQGMFYLKENYLNIKDEKNSYWLIKEDDLYVKIERSDKDMENDYVPNLSEHSKLQELGLEEDDFYISGWETTIKEMRENPGIVYHYTTEEKWIKIKKSKELRTSSGSGLTNRNSSGIFTSTSPETNALGSYGDVLLEIDLSAFKQHEKIDKLDLEPEPDVLEAAINEAFAKELGFHNYEQYVSEDMSSDTVIVGHSIPIKYIKRL